MIPLWYSIFLALAGAYFGFWFGRSRTWGLIESAPRDTHKDEGKEEETEEEGGGEPEREELVRRTVSERTVPKSRKSAVRAPERFYGRCLVSPAGGKLQSYQGEEESGVRILTTENRLYAPVAGRILKILPRGNAFLIRTDWGGNVLVRACKSEDDLLDQYFRPRVIRGEIIRKGKLLLEYDREILCRRCEDTAVYVTVEKEEMQILQMTEKTQVKAGETILWILCDPAEKENLYVTM